MKIGEACLTLIDVFEHSLERAELADKTCLEVVRKDRAEALTFGQLKKSSRQFALHLIDSEGIRTGEKVGILGKNRAGWDVAFWGVVLAGGVPVLIDPARPLGSVKKHLLYTDSRLVISADDYADKGAREELERFLGDRGIKSIEMGVFEGPGLDEVRSAMLATKVRSEVGCNDTAVLLCTSGTTGEPREVEISHMNLIANIHGALDTVHITSEDKLGHIIPAHHSFGLTVGKLMPLWVGATNVYTNRYRQVSALIKEKGVTIFVGIPALYSVFAKKLEERLSAQKQKSGFVRLMDMRFPKRLGKSIAKKQGWGGLRFFVSGAAPMPKWVLDTFWKRGLELRDGYGITESSPIYGFNDSGKKLGSVGRAISTLQVKIVNEKNEKLKAGETGEILLGGMCIVKGYYKNIAATDAAIEKDENGIRWLRTGDLGYLDEDGYLFVTGRKKNLIVLPGGKNVNPEVVELVLSQAKYVEELLAVPRGLENSQSEHAERVKIIVRPDFEQIRTDMKLSRRELVERRDDLKKIIWESINECQRGSDELAGFERVTSSSDVEIEIKEFEKTSMGKIRRGQYTQS